MNNLQTKVDAVSVNAASAGTTVQVANSQLSGTADAIALNLNGALAGSSFAANAVSGSNGYETVNVTGAGAASTIDSILVGNTTRTNYTFSGDQNINVRGTGAQDPVSASVVSIDASELTGNLTLGRIAGNTTTASLSSAITTNATWSSATRPNPCGVRLALRKFHFVSKGWRAVAKSRLEVIEAMKSPLGRRRSSCPTMNTFFFKTFLPLVKTQSRSYETHASIYRNHLQ